MTKELITYRVLSGAAQAAWAELHAKRVAARRAANTPWNSSGKEVSEVDTAA